MGYYYMVFPSEKSTNFPRRDGTLNFFDDSTHQSPPTFRDICNEIEKNNGEILKKIENYKPLIPYFIGFILEPISIIKRKVLMET